MRIIIEPGIFRQDKLAERHQDLLALFAMVVKGRRHTIEIETAERPAYDRWVFDESKRTRELCQESLNRSLKLRARWTRTRTIRIADVVIPSWEPANLRLPLSSALRVLQRPLQLLVENARNERMFLGVMTRLVDSLELEKRIAENAIEIHTKGGIDENRVWIEKYGREPEEACRTWVMCDSDAKQPWRDASGTPVRELLGTGAAKLSDTCSEHKIPLHILWRRAIDNYVPLELLKTWSLLREQERLERHKKLARLSDEQRYHYNMKDGFLQDEKDPEYARKAGCLYHGLDQDVRDELQRGYNRRGFSVTDLFDETKIHDGLKPLRVYERWLRDDKQQKEAQQIAESIKELL